MPHAHLPPQLDSAELTVGLSIAQTPKDQFCASVPLHSPTPLSTPPGSTSASNMVAAFSETASGRASSASFMSSSDPSVMSWAVSNSECLNHTTNSSGYHYEPFFSDSPYDFGQNTSPYNKNYNLSFSTPFNSSCPSSYSNGLDLSGLPMDSINPFYPPDAYQIEPQPSLEIMDLADPSINRHLLQLRHEDYDSFGAIIKQEEQPLPYSSPYDSDVTRSSTPAGDGNFVGPLDRCYKIEVEECAIDKEQPYAQLIHRALMEAPGHTMILRDIYDWFKKNTDKAVDKETKGWQNSIRHNLSMNGAFEKVDQPCEESRRGFMWRLTEEAAREGVKSTTRYRSKQPNKRGHRSNNPLPQRQASGAKGGQAARRAARMRRHGGRGGMGGPGNCRSEPRSYRSVPNNAMGGGPVGGGELDLFDKQHSLPASFPLTPYYGSPILSDCEFDYKDVSLGSEFSSPHLSTVSSHPHGPHGPTSSALDYFQSRSYNASPFTQDMPACGDSSYIQEPLNPADPMIFANSPSPAADEPRTPDSHLGGGGGWGPDDLLIGGGELGMDGLAMAYDAAYNEFPV